MRPGSPPEYSTRWSYPVLLVLANATLLLPAGHPLRLLGGLLLMGWLPGWLWSRRLFPAESRLFQGVIAAGLSYTLTLLSTLLLHYLSGPVALWPLLVVANVAALLPLLLSATGERSVRATIPWALLLVLTGAVFLRAVNLNYSEFQGDEALAMISAAEALTGHEDALFIRSKGPAEVLLPMWLWRFSGVISEGAARLPFTLAALLGIVTMYLLGERLHSRRVGWLAAAVFALNGFMVAFGRIVQYQSLVVWFSAAAFLLVWQWQQRGQQRAALLGGLFLGAGLLAHYDTVLVLPAIGWLLLAGAMSAAGPALTAAGLFGGGLLVTALPFYLPFALDPQAGRTGDYVGGRIGSQLRNNLPDFFHYTDFYSSFYYLLLSGLLVAAALIWLTWPGGRRWRVVAGVALVGGRVP
jgi:hypothetical protein